MTEQQIDVQKLLDALANQRNVALDQVASLSAQVASLKEQLDAALSAVDRPVETH